MKLTRLILACTLLLLTSFPLFALPRCGACEDNECAFGPYNGTLCRYDSGFCETRFGPCSTVAPEATLASEWTVVSIEITRPAVDSKIVPTPADAAEVRTPETTEQK